jgi:hypothetical protein
VPQKTLTPSTPKQMNFWAISFHGKPPPISNASIITLVQLSSLISNHPIQRDENGNLYQIFHHITMDKQSQLVVNCKNFIVQLRVM